jgi:hypothetical protein
MKRLFALLLMLLTLWGCGPAVPEEPPGLLPDNIQITFLKESRDFGGFTAAVSGGEAERIRALAESALAEYPHGLLEQLGTVEILLTGNLTGEGQFAGGSYAGFTQKTESGWRMVLSAACHSGTVHHELGHILDGILTDAGRLSEAQWQKLNPSGFRYGSGDWEGVSEFFADPYAMTNLTEDRAAVFEAAVMGGQGAFDGKSPLWLKLYTFSEAIRGHFDTDGWPAAAVWELALR